MPQIERRADCPCVHIVELAGRLETESQLVKMTIEHCQETSGNRVKAICDDLEESNLRIKECLLSMETTSQKFGEGINRFKDIERGIDTLAREQANQYKKLIMMAKYMVALTLWVAGNTTVSLLNGHISTIWKSVTVILKTIFVGA